MMHYKHPSALWILTLVESLNTLILFGLVSGLILFMTQAMHLPIAQAGTLYGGFLLMAYLTPLLGGALSDHFFQNKTVVFIGCILTTLGTLAFAIHQTSFFRWGLALVGVGIGLCKANIVAMVSNLYENHQLTERNQGITWLYAGMNVGAIIGAIVLGALENYISWTFGFIVFTVLAAFNCILISRFSSKTLVRTPAHQTRLHALFKKQILLPPVLGLMIWGLSFLLEHLTLFRDASAGLIVIVLVWLLAFLLKQPKDIRGNLWLLLLFYLGTLLFFASELQAGGTITLFLQAHIRSKIFHHPIPIEFFTALLPLFVALGPITILPLISRLNPTFSVSKLLFHKTQWGFLLASLAFLIFAFSTTLCVHSALFFGGLIVLAYALLGFGEVLIAPAVLSAATYLAPEHLRGTFLGFNYLAFALSGLLAGEITALTGNTHIQGVSSIQLTFITCLIILLLCALGFKGISISVADVMVSKRIRMITRCQSIPGKP